MTLNPFSKIIIVGWPLGPVRSSIFGFYLYQQHGEWDPSFEVVSKLQAKSKEEKRICAQLLKLNACSQWYISFSKFTPLICTVKTTDNQMWTLCLIGYIFIQTTIAIKSNDNRPSWRDVSLTWDRVFICQLTPSEMIITFFDI